MRKIIALVVITLVGCKSTKHNCDAYGSDHGVKKKTFLIASKK